MRFEQCQLDGVSIVTVVLSERNLRALLAKLEGKPPQTQCMIVCDDLATSTHLRVKAETDQMHYFARRLEGKKPGKMHPDTEEYIKAEQQSDKE